MLIIKLAWRNIWRNPRRSTVLILAIGMGFFTVLGMISYMNGLAAQMLETSIGVQGGHMQVAREGYSENPTIRKVLDRAAVETLLREVPDVASSAAVQTAGMIQSAENAYGANISGVEAADEMKVTTIHQYVREGTYLTGADREILISTEMAERLNVLLGEKVVLLANDLDNDVSGGAYRIVGLFATTSDAFDRANVYISLRDAQALLGYGDVVSTVAMRLAPGVDLDAALANVEAHLPEGTEVLSWRDRNKALVLMMDAWDYGILILVVILFTAVAFTIVNSFLMVIFERIREIGVMMANGVHPRKVRVMLYAEAFLMMLIGFAFGAVVTVAFLVYFGNHGIDLSNFAEGLRSIGVGSVIYPIANPRHFLLSSVTIAVMVMLSVVYPAFKASRFGVVEAINHV